MSGSSRWWSQCLNSCHPCWKYRWSPSLVLLAWPHSTHCSRLGELKISLSLTHCHSAVHTNKYNFLKKKCPKTTASFYWSLCCIGQLGESILGLLPSHSPQSLDWLEYPWCHIHLADSWCCPSALNMTRIVNQHIWACVPLQVRRLCSVNVLRKKKLQFPIS